VSDSNFSDEDLSNLSQWLRIFSEPNRLFLFEKIMSGVQCNCELGDALQLAPNLISHHLSVLKEAGLINAERDPEDGRWIYYSINVEVVNKIKNLFYEFFDSNRVKPRGSSCGPHVTEEQRQSLMRMLKK